MDCKQLTTHIARLEGQLRALRTQIETEQSCTHIVPLALAAAKSFDSLRAKMLEHYVSTQLCLPESHQEQLQQMLKLAKA
ncbi:metal-sensing transcriptional repressor [Candidatus Peribacteria bacterium]|nr:metal-sensing transcriptional repressor [Candidatus Peribacteria bacterium]